MRSAGAREGWQVAVDTKVKVRDEEVRRVFDASEILARYGINAKWSPAALCVAVVARLPKSADRKLFNSLAEGCGTRAELIELAATTLEAFKKRQTPLRPPPLGENGSHFASETSDEAETPYLVK
jgi:hypothetical protein